MIIRYLVQRVLCYCKVAPHCPVVLLMYKGATQRMLNSSNNDWSIIFCTQLRIVIQYIIRKYKSASETSDPMKHTGLKTQEKLQYLFFSLAQKNYSKCIFLGSCTQNKIKKYPVLEVKNRGRDNQRSTKKDINYLVTINVLCQVPELHLNTIC